MAAAILRSLALSSSLPYSARHLTIHLPRSPKLISPSILRSLSSSSSNLINSSASFDWSDSEENPNPKPKPIDKSKLPPPYDPFNKNKNPILDEPSDPSNLQEVFHKMRSDGFYSHAVRMFTALSQDGLTHEAMELFAVIKDKSTMPDVVAHTAVIEAYANAGGHSKDALRTYERMLASGVLPNAYTYSVLIKGMAKDGRVGDARKFLGEMMGKGMRPNAGTCVALMEACVREGKVDEGREVVEEIRKRGFVPDEKVVREVLGKRGNMFRSVMGLLFGK